MIVIDNNSLVAKLRGGEAEPVNAGTAVFDFLWVFFFSFHFFTPFWLLIQKFYREGSRARRTKICMRAGFTRCRNLTFLIRL